MHLPIMIIAQAKSFYRFHFPIILISLIAFLTLLAWLNRFIQDDAFISFRYADNFVNGQGLVWNPGERVEGYTNFLWTLLMAIPIALGQDPVPFSLGLGLACFALSLYLTYLLSSAVLESRGYGLLVMLLLGANYTFSAYATGGLETQMQACLFVASAYVAIWAAGAGRWSTGSALLLSILLAAALLIRLDSALLVVVLFPAACYFIIVRDRRPVLLAALCLPLAIIIGGWLAWKLAFYGDILPNTFYAKVSGAALGERGAYYLYIFFRSYWLIPVLLLAPFALLKAARRWNPAVAILAAIVALWLVYIAKVGGDFMEFRFLVPILPFFFILAVMTIRQVSARKAVQAALAAVIVLGSLWHATTFTGITSGKHWGIESIEELSSHVTAHGQNWPHIGRLLGDAFEHRQDVVIATTAAGAIPYYSRLGTIDMLGLSDKRVAREGVVVGTVPGHGRMAQFSYLRERKVNLLIGALWIRSSDESMYQPHTLNSIRNITIITEHDKVPYDSMLVEIPVDRQWVLTILYLTRHPFIDDVIRQNGWKAWPVSELSS